MRVPLSPPLLAIGLIFAGLVRGAPADAPRSESTLREAAGPTLAIGCAVSSDDVRNPERAALLVRQYDCLVAENAMMPSSLVEEPGQYTFADGDTIANFALAHHLDFYGHMLIWHHVTRDWLFKDKDGKPLPRTQALQNLKSYIDDVVGHYRGKVKAWNVVNEAISDDDNEYLRNTPARQAIGDDYIEQAFRLAHAADPKAELYYNDYNIEEPGKREKTLRLLRSLREHHVPIDAVGIQGHWLLDFPKPGVITDAIKAFHDAGFKVMVTELDVDVLPRTTSGADLATVDVGPNPYPNGLPETVQQQLAARYRELFQEMLKPPGVSMITFWGPNDARSWLNDFPVEHRTNYPLLFDRHDQPKPAYHAVIEVLDQARERATRSQ